MDLENNKNELFFNWLKENGALINNLNYPQYFKSMYFDVPGVTVNKDIQPYEAICAIPYKLLLSSDKIYNNELLIKIIDENPILFNESQNENYEFNRDLLLMMYEKNKGTKSFFFPYLNYIDTISPISWKRDEVNSISELRLYQEVIENNSYVLSEFLLFTKMFKKYEGFDKIDLKTFIWCNENISTRIFGWFSPFNILCPMIDFVNHYDDPNCSTDYISLKNVFDNNYIAKNCNDIKYNMQSILDEYMEYFKISKDLNKYNIIDNKLNLSSDLSFIHKNMNLLSERDKEDLIKYINIKIPENLKFEKLSIIISNKIKNENLNIWDFEDFFDSDIEDNDTDSESESINESVKDIQIKQNNKDKERKAKENKDKEKINKKFKYDKNDKNNNYFILFNESNFTIKKGEQLKLTYGSRNNFFLLLWYGFSLPYNKYDSLTFRLRMENKSNLSNFANNIYDYIILDTIKAEDISNGYINTFDNIKIDLKNITKEFRLKFNRINLDLLKFIRVYLSLLFYDKSKDDMSNYSEPSDINIEINTIKKYEEIVLFLDLKYKNTVKNMEEFCKQDNNINIKFIYWYEINMKRIAQEHLNFCKITKSILQKKLKINDINNEIEEPNNSLINRLKIKEYLKQVKNLL